MDKQTMKLFWGIVLILAGIFFLLVTTDVISIKINAAWLFGILFFLGFLIFIGIYISMHRNQFWPLIPGIISLGLALLILGEEIGLKGNVAPGMFIMFIGLSFLAVAILHKENWWAIIPAGMVASVSLVIFFGDTVGVGLMFAGMGLTFIALYFILLNTEEKHWWPLMPGGILAFMGFLFLFFGEVGFGKFILPSALIIIGLILIINHLRAAKRAE